MTTLSLVAHPDDDLLFLNPDIASDIQADRATWIAYLTAGNLDPGPDGMEYADQRIEGLRAAYARAAKVADDWDFELITLPNGRQLSSNFLVEKPTVHLVFTFINAANGDDNGDLFRMWNDEDFTATPIDERPSYTRASFIAMLKGLIAHVQPGFLRTTDPIGFEIGDHIDHTYAAKFTAAANLNGSGKMVKRMDTYFGYAAANFPPNFSGYWAGEKLAMWQAYTPHDSAFPPGGPTGWDDLAVREFRRHVWMPGDSWQDM
jgi:LmbE family N-acetylglucosaminyl deacetylase